MRLRRLALLVGVAVSCAACAPAVRAPDRVDLPLTVTLPTSLAGLHDARRPFARLFERELRRADPGSEPKVGHWLHGATTDTVGSPGVAASLDAAFEARAATSAVLIAPGLFGDCVDDQSVPFGDGVRRSPEASATEAYRQYADLGLREIRLLRVPGRASTAVNGRLLAEAIRAESSRADLDRLVLIGYSKGAPDLLEALALLDRDGGVPGKVKAVVSVAGVVMGTPLAERYLGVYETLAAHVVPFGCTPSQGGELASLTRAERARSLAAAALPTRITYHTVVAHTSIDEIALPLRPSARWLASFDPRNDGQILASDAMLPGSQLIAEARADHWDVALPRDRHPDRAVRLLTSQRGYPREALFRAIVRWAIGSTDPHGTARQWQTPPAGPRPPS